MSDEPGEARDSAEPEETALDHAEGTDDAETEFHPFDEVDEDFQPGPAMRVMGPDGLPQTVDTTTESDIPALSVQSLVCMADVSKFVIRDRWRDVIATFEPSEVERTPSGVWRVKMEIATERARSAVDRTRAKLDERGGPYSDLQLLATAMGSDRFHIDSDWVSVEPVRPQCKHYVRQQGSFHLNAQNKKHYRLCAARRTTEGTFMTVSDLGMWACDMRDPYDVASVKHLDDFDTMKIKQGKERTNLPMFQGFGIFDTPKKNDDEQKEN
jgi:hypothetical protein